MYTIGEFGAKTGLSSRTLRFYEELGILYPKQRNQNGHRLYGLEELATLQRIQSLKFIGYSLQEIKEILSSEKITLESFANTLPVQKKILVHKREELNQAIEAIEYVQDLLNDGIPLDWRILTSLLYSMEFEEEQNEWIKEHFEGEMATIFTDIPKELRKKLDKETLFILVDVKKLIRDQVPAHAPEAQQILVRLTDLFLQAIPKEAMNNLDEWENQLEAAQPDDFDFPNFWTAEEEAYLEEITKVMEQNYKDEE
ncbi:putative transcriptional regulator [Bacillus sp. TS-2]|nr:putative transcriptional regulator [Bacillus sp. TS-2]